MIGLDRGYEILSWGPITELDPLRISFQIQVIRIFLKIGVKAMLDGTLARELPAIETGSASSQSWQGANSMPVRRHRKTGTGKPEPHGEGWRKIGAEGGNPPLTHTRAREATLAAGPSAHQRPGRQPSPLEPPALGLVRGNPAPGGGDAKNMGLRGVKIWEKKRKCPLPDPYTRARKATLAAGPSTYRPVSVGNRPSEIRFGSTHK